MFSIFRRPARPVVVQFCESCGQACTAACRAQAHYERTRDLAVLTTAFPR